MTYSIPSRIGRLLPMAAAIGIAACDIPSEPPIFQQTWLVPADSVVVGMATLLPTDVDTANGGTTITAATDTMTFSTTLADLCGAPECQVPGDVTIPNTPAFTSPPGELASSIALPAGVNAVTIAGGTLRIEVTNDLGFDLLRPNGVGAVAYGTLSIEISSGALTQTTNFTGSATVGMPDGATTTFNVPLPVGAYTGSIDVEVSFNVPQGGSATVNSTNQISIDASVQALAISSATVVVNAKSVTTDPTSFDLEEIDLGDMVEGAGLVLTLVNPFNVTANLNIVLAAPAQGGEPAVNISKAFVMAANATSTVDLVITKTEIQQLLGKNGVTIDVTGTATGQGAGNTVTVTPTQKLIIRTQMSLTLNVGA